MVKNYILSAALLATTLTASAQEFSMLPFAPGAAHVPAATAEGDATEVTYGYYTGIEELGLLSMNNLNSGETVDLAIRLLDSSIAGSQIKGVSFYAMGTDVSHYSNFKVWISTSLTAKGTSIVRSKEVEVIEEGMYRVEFDSTYTVPVAGCYVGYTFTIDQVVSDYDKTIVMANGTKNNSFNIHSSRTFSTWKNYSTAGYGMLTLQAHLLMEGIPEIGINVDGVEAINVALTDPEALIPVTVTNKGQQAVTTIGYDYTVGNVSGSNTVAVEISNRVLNCQSLVKLPVPMPAEPGLHPVTIQIKTLNGTPAELAPIATTVNAMSFIPKHRVLIEEYTGTWCGWCPRGAVAMHKMRELHPDDFVGICIHNGDAMQVTGTYPNSVPGFPDAYIERAIEVDPYYGAGESNFGIEADWAARQAILAPADLNLTAEWDEAEQNIIVKTSVRFATDPKSANYRLAYVLLADSLYGWAQQNYYTQYSASQLPSDLAFLASAGSTYSPYYEDVMIAFSTPFSGITGSIPADAVINEPFDHSYTFANAAGNSLVQDKTKLEVVVVLVNGSNNTVVNANKAHVVPFGTSTAIEDIATDRKPAAGTAAFDLTGRSLTAGAKGLQVRDGKVILVK